MGQLQTIKMTEGGFVDNYIKKAQKLRNKLSIMGERITDPNLSQIVLNGLPRSYEGTIQTLTHLDSNIHLKN